MIDNNRYLGVNTIRITLRPLVCAVVEQRYFSSKISYPQTWLQFQPSWIKLNLKLHKMSSKTNQAKQNEKVWTDQEKIFFPERSS